MRFVNKNDSTAVRLIKLFGSGAIVGAVIGGLLGATMGYLDIDRITLDIQSFALEEKLELVFLGLTILTFVMTVYFMYHVRRLYKSYQISNDDETSDGLYRRIGKYHSYALILSGLGLVFAMSSLVFGFKVVGETDFFEMTFSIFPLLAIFVGTGLQIDIMKWHNKIKGAKTPLVPTFKELKNNALELDEAELQANYKISYDIVLNLTNIVLPSIYLFLMFWSFITGEADVLALLITTIIYSYIMLMQFKMVKDFYK
ncbi:DUF3169 family protein [Streptococcus fryi]